MMVMPIHQKQGVGSAMVDFIVEDSRKGNLKVMKPIASVAGHALYQKSGFRDCPPSAPGMMRILAREKS